VHESLTSMLSFVLRPTSYIVLEIELTKNY